MNSKRIAGVSVALLLALMMSACNLGKTPSTDSLGYDQEEIAQTVMVLQTQLAVPTATQSVPTAEVSPTSAVTETATQPVVIAIPTATEGIRYKAGPVTDVTYLDNTVVQPGAAFVKTWRVQNSGTATWNSTFKIVFVSGDAMGGPASQAIGRSVPPGETIDISLSLIAPSTLTTLRGNWMLETDTGTRFGIGVNADSPFWVQIIVKKSFAATGATPNGPATWSGTCPGSVPLTATITSSAAGTITYYYVVNGETSPTLSSTFSGAGTNTTTAHNFPVTASGTLVVQVYIDDPNHQLFPSSISIPVTCE
jgi:hypothetical protein